MSSADVWESTARLSFKAHADPQCGFAYTATGNLLTEDDRECELELVVQVVDKVWY